MTTILSLGLGRSVQHHHRYPPYSILSPSLTTQIEEEIGLMSITDDKIGQDLAVPIEINYSSTTFKTSSTKAGEQFLKIRYNCCQRMTMKELLDCKHPTAWIEFEKGLIDEMELARIFFKDGRHFDLEDGTSSDIFQRRKAF